MSALRVYGQGLVVGREDFRAFWTWRTWFSAWMLRIITSAAIWVLLGRLLGSEEKRHFLLIGNGVVAGATAAAFAIPAATWSRFEGTYPLLVVAPAGLLPATMGRTSVWLFNAVATSLFTFAVLIAVFGFPISLRAALLLPAPVTLVCTSSYCLALFLGAVVNRASRLRNIISYVTTALLMAFCGVSVPLTFWPWWVQALANVLPVTHGSAAVRLLLAGGSTSTLVREAALEAVVGVGWLVASLATMERLANGGRASGSIELE